MKVAINACYGGFSVSKAVYEEMGLKWDGFGYEFSKYNEQRADPKLIAAIEKVGIEAANGLNSEIKIIEIPDDIEWFIYDEEGWETVHENHRSWS